MNNMTIQPNLILLQDEEGTNRKEIYGEETDNEGTKRKEIYGEEIY